MGRIEYFINLTMQLQEPTKLSNLQLELLKLFSFNTSEEEMADIKRILAKYYAEKATGEMDRLWNQKQWTNETMDLWLKEHKRTPYK